MVRMFVTLDAVTAAAPTGADTRLVDVKLKLAIAVSRDATLSEITLNEPGWSSGPPLVVVLCRSVAVLYANALPVAMKARAAITSNRLRPPASRLNEADKLCPPGDSPLIPWERFTGFLNVG